MPYDEGLVQRIREQLEDDSRVTEKKMFGGIVFFVNGNMAAGTLKDELMVRVGPDGHDAAIAQPHARAMDFTGRPMRGFVQVAPAGFEEDAELRAWLARGIAFAERRATKAPHAKQEGKKRAKPKAATKKPRSARAKPNKSPRVTRPG
jgi:TfoX/Sxy family transcriptional regulator of competence genes